MRFQDIIIRKLGSMRINADARIGEYKEVAGVLSPWKLVLS
jgi:hypothetical protein